MKFSGMILVAVILLSLGGCYVNFNLTAMHVGASTPAWFDQACNPDDTSAFNCKDVLKTKWAFFSLQPPGFAEPDPETGQVRGLPVALAGWWYFSVLFVWFAFVGRPDYAARRWHRLPVLLVLAGCAVSAMFIYLMLTKLDQRCIWCIVSHAINFLLLVGVVLLRPRPPVPEADAEAEASPPPLSPGGHPSGRLVAATLACAAALVFAETNRFGGARSAALVRLYQSEIERMHRDTDTQLSQFMGQTSEKIPVRSDDPARGGEQLTLTVFSDFQCPGCRKLAEVMEDKLLPEYAWLRVVWKHYPICKECNPHVKNDLHKEACKLARAAEAARLQGGNEAFWKAHDFFFENQRLLKGLRYEKLAEHLEIDLDRFLADMESDAVKNRVREDCDLAKEVGVTSTPGLFLANRPIKSYMLINADFMADIKKRLDEVLEARERAVRQRAPRSAPAATPGSRDRPDAP